MAFREYAVSDEAVRQGVKLGLLENTGKRIARMAKQSVPYTHPAGNRRFDSYVLRIEDNTVTAISSNDQGGSK